MITADSSAWVDFLNGRQSAATDLLDAHIQTAGFVIGDLVAMEVLRGIGDATKADRIARNFERFPWVPMAPTPILLKAAENYRYLRTLGITVRSTIDCIIASFCIEGGHSLIHADHDFDAFEQHLGLRVLR